MSCNSRWPGAPATLKIGLVAPFEGLHRSLGYEVLFGVKLAIQERNVEGGVAGYQIELVALNDFDQPAEAELQARSLKADPEVLGLIGHLSSATTLAALPIYQAADLALCIPWPVELGPVERREGVVSLAATPAELKAVLEQLARREGWTQKFSLARPDIEAIPAQTQVLELATDGVMAGEIMLALEQRDQTLPVIGQANVGSSQLTQVAKAAANNLIFVSPGPDPADLPGAADFRQAYQAQAGFPAGPRALLAYDATQVLLDAIEQAIVTKQGQKPTRAEVRATLNDVRRQGLSGHISFDQQGRRLEAPSWLYQIVDEQYPGLQINSQE